MTKLTPKFKITSKFFLRGFFQGVRLTVALFSPGIIYVWWVDRKETFTFVVMATICFIALVTTGFDVWKEIQTDKSDKTYIDVAHERLTKRESILIPYYVANVLDHSTINFQTIDADTDANLAVYEKWLAKPQPALVNPFNGNLLSLDKWFDFGGDTEWAVTLMNKYNTKTS